MRLAHVTLGAMLLTGSIFAQTTTSPNSNPDTYNQNTYPYNTYHQTTAVKTGHGGWGLLGLLGLLGLTGLRRRETIVRGRTEYSNEPRRRVA